MFKTFAERAKTERDRAKEAKAKDDANIAAIKERDAKIVQLTQALDTCQQELASALAASAASDADKAALQSKVDELGSLVSQVSAEYGDSQAATQELITSVEANTLTPITDAMVAAVDQSPIENTPAIDAAIAETVDQPVITSDQAGEEAATALGEAVIATVEG
ncbi:MAG: hypothetical protein ACRCYP_01680 [Alphaproteobacteria bacterium]